MDRFIKWIMKTRAWEFILRSINKIDFKISGAKPLFDMSDYHDIKNKLSINHTEYSLYTFATSDVSSLISTSIRKITNGNYNHAGIILYNKLSGMAKAFHITTQGLREEDLLEVLRDTDYISINKIDLNTEDKYKKALERIEYLRSIKDLIKYDYRISLGNGESELYCSEGTLFVLKGIYEHVKLKPELIYGISVFPPSNVSKLGEVIFTNHPEG